MFKTIYCFAFAIFGMLLLVPFGLFGVLLSLLGIKKLMAVYLYRLGQIWGNMIIKVIGCTVTVTGRENIPHKSGVCFVSNHGSIFDILLLLAYAGRPIGFIAKKELLFIPVLNMWIAALGGLFIDRNNPRNALKTINTGVARLKSGGGMIIFPEGHRSRGQGLLPFRPGSFKLATNSDATIVPVALANTWDIFEKNYRVNSCPISITFCKPVNTADIPVSDRKQALADQIFAIIQGALAATPQ